MLSPHQWKNTCKNVNEFLKHYMATTYHSNWFQAPYLFFAGNVKVGEEMKNYSPCGSQRILHFWELIGFV